MASLHMIRADIDAQNLQRWAGSRRLQDSDHAMHCLLTEMFGELAPKPFRLMIGRAQPRGVLYGYGQADAEALRAEADIHACPLQARVIPAASLDSKPMPAAWQTGKRLGFETRVRPIIRRPRGAGDCADTECDAFLWEAVKDHATAVKEGRPERELNRGKVYSRWLADQFERHGGAKLEGKARLQSFQRSRAIRKRHARSSEGPDALMRGTLTITNAGAFAELLARGIGRHRAYGYGMLLLRPAAAKAVPLHTQG